MLFHSLETERLILKNIDRNDNELILKEFSNDIINEFLFDCEPMSKIEDADELIDFYLEEEPRCQHRWILTNKETGERMGSCGFHCWNQESGVCEIGYEMLPQFWKHGYMDEALTAIIAFAKQEMQVNQITAVIAEANINSMKTICKQGFQYQGDTTVLEFRGKEYLHKNYILICK